MDCEKFESTLLDELYDELDEVTSAAAKRHVGGCARCAALLSGLKATRRVAVLSIVEPPADLEDRILAAAREAQKVVPLTRRASRAISWAGSWAMRPQTGMAAVFLLMTGLSALLLQGKHGARSASPVTVSEQGEPVPSAAAGSLARAPATTLDEMKSATAVAAAPALPTEASASALRGSSDLLMDGVSSKAHAAGRVNVPTKPAPPMEVARGSLRDKDDSLNAPALGGGGLARNAYATGPAGAGAGAPAAPPSPRAAAPPPAFEPSSPASLESQLSYGGGGAGTSTGGATNGFSVAMAAYNAGDYGTATTQFDALAATGDLGSALWAARSVRRGSGCAAAAPRFDQVARAGTGTAPGYDATFEGAQCYRQLGQADLAQTRFRSLLTVTSYVDRAKNELAQMGPNASTKQRAKAAQQQAAPTQQASPPPQATATTLPVDAK